LLPVGRRHRERGADGQTDEPDEREDLAEEAPPTDEPVVEPPAETPNNGPTPAIPLDASDTEPLADPDATPADIGLIEVRPEPDPLPVLTPPEPPVKQPDARPVQNQEPEAPADKPDVPAADAPATHGALAEAEGPVRDANAGARDIVEGVTAPYYRLTSLDEYLRMAWEHGGRFLAWNGSIAVKIGPTLDPNAADFEVLDRSWHRRYATRVAPLPQGDPAVRTMWQRVLTEYPKMGLKTQIMLSLPYAYDQEILRAQREWFELRGLEIDVRAVTEGRFETAFGNNPPRFRIAQVLRDGYPVSDAIPIPSNEPSPRAEVPGMDGTAAVPAVQRDPQTVGWVSDPTPRPQQPTLPLRPATQ
jgi:hypothetical protein